MNKLFQWLLPAQLRTPAELPESEASRKRALFRLANVGDNDASYTALMEVVHGQFVEEVTALLSNDLGQARVSGRNREAEMSVNVSQVSGSGATEFQRGRAAALFALLMNIEASRQDAREQAKQIALAEQRAKATGT